MKPDPRSEVEQPTWVPREMRLRRGPQGPLLVREEPPTPAVQRGSGWTAGAGFELVAHGDVVGEGGSLPGWTGAEVAAYRRAVEKLAAALESAHQPPAAGRQDASGPGRRPPVRHRPEPDERAAWRMSNVS